MRCHRIPTLPSIQLGQHAVLPLPHSCPLAPVPTYPLIKTHAVFYPNREYGSFTGFRSPLPRPNR